VVKVAMVLPVNNSFMRKAGMDNTWINHGIASIMAYCSKHGMDVDLIDMRKMSWEEYESLIGNYDVVSYSVLSNDIFKTFKALEIAKNKNSSIITVVGGVDPSSEPDKYLANSFIDHVVGEGEISFYKLVRNIEDGKPNERLIQGEKIENLDEIPFIDREKWGEEELYNFRGIEAPFSTIISSRSCKFNCKFCQPGSKRIFGYKERIRSLKMLLRNF